MKKEVWMTGLLLLQINLNYLCAQAVLDSLPDTQLSPLVLTAQFSPTDVRQTVNTVRVIQQKTIEQRAAINLEELLQTETNLRISQDAILGSSLGINGLRGENVKVMIDGVPVVGRLNGSVDVGQLPLGAVQQVEIIEGAQSLLYGSEASAGIINLVSRKNQAHRLEAEANTQWESNGFGRLQAQAGARMGKFLLMLTGQQTKFKPQIDTSESRDQLWNPKNQASGRAVLRFSATKKLDLRLIGSLFTEKVDNLGEMRRPNYKPYAFDDYYHTKRKELSLQGEGWLPGRWFWQSTLGWNRFERIKNSYRFDFEEAIKSLLDGQQDTSAATGVLARATVARDRADRRWNALFGLEHYQESAEGIRIIDSSSLSAGKAVGYDLGLFGSGKAAFYKQKLLVQAGARWTLNKLYGPAVTPSVWVLWRPEKHWKIRISYANGFRSPGLKELYFNFIDVNHYVVGNTNLRPERSDNVRAEVNWQSSLHKHATLGITGSGFYNAVQHRIILAEFGPAQYRYANLQRWETMGAGLGANFRFRQWLRFRTEVLLTGFYNTYSEENEGLPKLNWSPDWVNDLTISMIRQRYTLSIWHKMTGKTPYFFEDMAELKQGESESWHLLNASLGGHFFKHKISLNLGMKNLLNIRMIRSSAGNDVGHDSGAQQPVHWGRSVFIAAIFRINSKT